MVSACDDSGKLKAEHQRMQDELISRYLDNIMVLKVWTFQVDDFGRLTWENLPLTGESDDEPLHDVTLIDFSIS